MSAFAGQPGGRRRTALLIHAGACDIELQRSSCEPGTQALAGVHLAGVADDAMVIGAEQYRVAAFEGCLGPECAECALELAHARSAVGQRRAGREAETAFKVFALCPVDPDDSTG